ncbi:MAG: transposase [Desulfohalobiaceae bacterium]|nr:transposase [Desulfohalobiaceae bacterium]
MPGAASSSENRVGYEPKQARPLSSQGSTGRCHHVFSGNTTDPTTFIRVVKDFKKRFCLKRVIFVCDRGMITRENVATIKELGLDYILAHSPRNCSDSLPFFRESHRELQNSKGDSYAEKRFSNSRCDLFRSRQSRRNKKGAGEKIAKAAAFIHGVKKNLKIRVLSLRHGSATGGPRGAANHAHSAGTKTQNRL